MGCLPFTGLGAGIGQTHGWVDRSPFCFAPTSASAFILDDGLTAITHRQAKSTLFFNNDSVFDKESFKW